MEENKLLRKSWASANALIEYPTMQDVITIRAELVMRFWSDGVKRVDGLASVECYFVTESGFKFRAFVFPRRVDGENVWKPVSSDIDFRDATIKDRYNDDVGDVFELTFKKNKKHRTYLDNAVLIREGE